MRNVYMVLASLCLCANSMASEYIVAGVGTVDLGLDNIADFDDPTGYELIIGTEINDSIAIEGSYVDFGEAKASTGRFSTNAFTAGVVAKAEDDLISIMLKAGIQRWDAEASGIGGTAEDTGVDVFLGVGAAVRINKEISVGVRYNVYNMDGDNLKMLSLNAQVGF